MLYICKTCYAEAAAESASRIVNARRSAYDYPHLPTVNARCIQVLHISRPENAAALSPKNTTQCGGCSRLQNWVAKAAAEAASDASHVARAIAWALKIWEIKQVTLGSSILKLQTRALK